MTQAVTPDFIPDTQQSAPDFIPDASAPQQPESQGSAAMRFLKAAAGRYFGATLNAGPTTSTPATYGTPEWQRAEQELYQRYQQGKPQPGLTDFLKASSLSNVPENALNEVKSLNPIDMQKFQSGDTAGGLGSSLMNLLLIRSGFKQMRGAEVPEFGSPAQGAEMVQPLTGYTKSVPRQQLALPSAPIELGPSSTIPQTIEGVLPAARKVYESGKVQYLTRPLRPGEAPDVAKNTNTLAQDYFIQKMRDAMERQTVSGSAEQDAALQRMQEYAKSPVDPMQGSASGPVESPQFAYRMRDAGETGIMPNPKKTAQASLDPAKVQSYEPGRATAQNHPQEMVRIDLSKLSPNEYEVQPNGYVKFKGAVPESYIEKMGSKAISEAAPKQVLSGMDLINALRTMAAAKAAGK